MTTSTGDFRRRRTSSRRGDTTAAWPSPAPRRRQGVRTQAHDAPHPPRGQREAAGRGEGRVGRAFISRRRITSDRAKRQWLQRCCPASKRRLTREVQTICAPPVYYCSGITTLKNLALPMPLYQNALLLARLACSLCVRFQSFRVVISGDFKGAGLHRKTTG